jgi:hypothetical protein
MCLTKPCKKSENETVLCNFAVPHKPDGKYLSNNPENSAQKFEKTAQKRTQAKSLPPEVKTDMECMVCSILALECLALINLILRHAEFISASYQRSMLDRS